MTENEFVLNHIMNFKINDHTDKAERELRDIYRSIASKGSAEKSTYVIVYTEYLGGGKQGNYYVKVDFDEIYKVKDCIETGENAIKITLKNGDHFFITDKDEIKSFVDWLLSNLQQASLPRIGCITE